MRNRILELIPPPRGWDGAALMAKAPSAAASKGATANVAERTAKLLTQVIDDRWPGSDRELYEAAKMSSSSLTNLKTQGAESVTPTLRKVCRVLRINADALLEGRIEKAVSSAQRTDLHDLLDSLIGTPDEATVERMLRALNSANAD